MAAPTYRTQSKFYVENQPGWRFLFFALALSCVAGLGFRLYFSPKQIKQWVTSALENQSDRYEIRFRDAELSLARGSIPQLAIVLKGVEVGPRPACTSVPALKVSEIRIPVQVVKLLTGKVRIGMVSGEELTVDVDGFKTQCGPDGKPVVDHQAPATTGVKPVQVVEGSQVPRKDHSAPKPWWTPEQLQQIQKAVAGFEFDRIEVWFEKRAKRVVLESFAVSSELGEEFVHLTTDLRVPPEVTYGQALPALTIEADAKADTAEVSVQADLSEGSLEGVAHLHPNADGELGIEARVAVSDLPLSTTVPLLTKAGIVKDNFRPKFLWLDCAAEIKGRFQGLFREQPIHLADCALEGSGGYIRLDKALRHPDGRWEPFQVTFENVDLRRMIETFGGKGPDGVASDFGRVSGSLGVESPQEARFEGVFEGAQIRFSNRSVRALQGVNRMHAKLDLKGERMSGTVDQVQLDRGLFEGSLNFDADREFRTGAVKIQVKSLVLNPFVQKVLVAGEIGRMTGAGEASIAEGKVSVVKGDWRVAHLNGREFRFRDAQFRTEYGGGDFHVTVKAPELELSRLSPLFVAGQPLFFGHRFEGDWIPLAETTIRAIVSDASGLQWESAEGKMENGKISVNSAGSLNRDRHLSGWVSLDYPAIKKLKWSLSGTMASPIFNDDSQSLSDLRSRLKIDDSVLGLPARDGKVPVEEETGVRAMTAKTTRGLRELGERVIEKAREIVPEVGGGTAQAAPVSATGVGANAPVVPATAPNSSVK